MIADVDTDSQVWLNGEFVRLGDAKVSVLDRGFVFGDGIYEVVPVYRGKLFRMEEHIARLQRSLGTIRIETGRSADDWKTLFQDVLQHSGVSTPDSMIYLQVTRGVAKRDHRFPSNVQPTIFCMVLPRTPPSVQAREQGLSAVAMPDLRWLNCHIKSVSLLGNVLAKQYAVDAGADEVIQFRDDVMTEGASCNIWVVRNGELLAPRRNNLILEGIRYGLLEELAQEAGITLRECVVTRNDVDEADELMLSSATTEVLPITRFEGRQVGKGVPGPVYQALRAGYDARLAAL